MRVFLNTLPEYARQFVEHLPTEVGKKAYIVGLSGELGAGKTAFVQEAAKALGVLDPVTSPTFIIVRTHEINRPPFKRLIHIDAYRLDPGHPDTIGWGHYASDPENLILAEWPERLPGGTPGGVQSLEFRVLSENEREITEKKS